MMVKGVTVTYSEKEHTCTFLNIEAVFALGHKKTGSWDPIGLKKRGPQNKNWVPT